MTTSIKSFLRWMKISLFILCGILPAEKQNLRAILPPAIPILDPYLDMTPNNMSGYTPRRMLAGGFDHSSTVRMRNGHFLTVAYTVTVGTVNEILIRTVTDVSAHADKWLSLWNWQHDPRGGSNMFGLMHPNQGSGYELWPSDQVNGAVFLDKGSPSVGMEHILRRHLRDPNYPDLTKGMPGWTPGTQFPWTEADSLLAIWAVVDVATASNWWFQQSTQSHQTRSVAVLRVTLVGITRMVKVVAYWNAAGGTWHILTAYPL